MKTRKLSIVVLLSVICVGFQYCLVASAQTSELLIATDEEKQGGYLVEITEEALKRVGYTANIQFFPWKRALRNGMDGEFDVLLGAYHTEERAQKMAYSEPIGKVDIGLFALKESTIRYTTLPDLTPYVIGYTRGAAVSNAFENATYLQKEAVANIELNIKKLLRGRVDLIVYKKQQLLPLIQTKYPESVDKVEFLDPPLRTSFFFNAFPKTRPDALKHLEDFNRGLQAIKDDGTYAKILEKHGIQE